jgi:hypothetical protein
MNNIVNLSPWAARATEVTADPALARFLAPVERRQLFDAAGNEAAHVGLYDDTKCVGVVSPTYHVLQNATAHDVVTDAIRGAGYNGQLDVKPVRGGRFGGRWGTRYILADHGFSIRQPGKHLQTRVDLELFLRTSYDGSTGTSIGVAMFDRFCDNGMVFPSQVEAFRAKHTRYAEDNLFRVTPQQVEVALAEAQEQAEIIRRWAETRITATQARELLKGLKVKEHKVEDTRPLSERTPRNELELLMAGFEQESEDRGQTLWALVSAVTAWSTPRDNVADMPTVRRGRSQDSLSLAEGRQDRAADWVLVLQNMARAA